MALSDIFYKVEGGVITKYNLRRGRIPWMGEESEDFAYQDKGYYTEVLINPTPTSTQKNSGVTYTVDEQNRTVIKEYHISKSYFFLQMEFLIDEVLRIH